jgi:hypothetical protein
LADVTRTRCLLLAVFESLLSPTAIVGGLGVATLVSLVALPTIYVLLNDLGAWGKRVHREALAPWRKSEDSE